MYILEWPSPQLLVLLLNNFTNDTQRITNDEQPLYNSRTTNLRSLLRTLYETRPLVKWNEDYGHEIVSIRKILTLPSCATPHAIKITMETTDMNIPMKHRRRLRVRTNSEIQQVIPKTMLILYSIHRVENDRRCTFYHDILRT